MRRISFATKKLADTFNSQKELKRVYGDRMAKTIMLRMAVLHAAETLALVPHQKPIRRHELVDNRKGQFAVDLVHPKRLVFKPDHDPVPLKEDGGIDLAAVVDIIIFEVVDYH